MISFVFKQNKGLVIFKVFSFLVIILLLGLFSFYFSSPLIAGDGGATLENPLGSGEDLKNPNFVIGKIINSVLGIVGTIALAMFIYGGLRWMISAGSKDGVQSGKDTMLWAALGMVVIFSAYAIVKFVLMDVVGIK